MKYWGEINGIKIYEMNPEKKAAAMERGMKILLELGLKKLAKKNNGKHE